MRNSQRVLMLGVVLGLSGGNLGCGKSGGSSTPVVLPRVYPPVRASTPDGLIADPTYAAGATATGSTQSSLQRKSSALDDAINLATAVQDRLFTMGPTEILRVVSDVDARTVTLDTRTSEHPCLTNAPVPFSYSFPGGQTFPIQLQCLESFGGSDTSGGWIAFGFDTALTAEPSADGDAEAGPDGGVMGTAGGGDHFYLAEGQNGGMGSVYRFDRLTDDVEGWISVADQNAPTNSQVIMHLTTNTAAATLELTLAGSAVGFCAAHLKTGANYLFIDAKTNAPPPPGTAMSADTQYCDAARTGCFDTTNLATDLGGDAAGCATLARPTFSIATDLDASSDPGSNVTPPTIYTYFTGQPTGIPAF